MGHRFLRQVLVTLGAGLLVGVMGCGGRGNRTRFIPSETTARDVLTAVLDSWQGGAATETITTASFTAHVADSLRRPGQKLTGYEILGEVPGDSPRCLAVRLHLEHPSAERTTRYVVFGVNPYWVLTHEDLQMLAHWDMDMGK